MPEIVKESNVLEAIFNLVEVSNDMNVLLPKLLDIYTRIKDVGLVKFNDPIRAECMSIFYKCFNAMRPLQGEIPFLIVYFEMSIPLIQNWEEYTQTLQNLEKNIQLFIYCIHIFNNNIAQCTDNGANETGSILSKYILKLKSFKSIPDVLAPNSEVERQRDEILSGNEIKSFYESKKMKEKLLSVIVLDKDIEKAKQSLEEFVEKDETPFTRAMERVINRQIGEAEAYSVGILALLSCETIATNERTELLILNARMTKNELMKFINK